MTADAESTPGVTKPSHLWVWWVCGLLLCASTINYMDRQTLSTTAARIKAEFELDNQRYGYLETAFGLAFAAGALTFGFIADRTNIRWLYPAVLLAWSTMGFLTGLVETYAGLLLCRLLLGLFEAGHWPCALKTTQRLLPTERRTLGNSVLQSGTAIGAIVTPQIIKQMVTDDVGSWRPAFQIIGLVGVGWVIVWLATIRGNELAPTARVAAGADPEPESFWSIILRPRFLTLFAVVILINTCYHFFRAWLTLFLIQGRGYSEAAAFDVLTWFYIVNDVGCLTTGFATAMLPLRGWSVHGSRLTVFGLCGLLTSAGLLLPWLPAGWGLIAALMVLSLGSLGLFPCYYAFTQELSTKHQGKVTGLLGTSAWLVTSPLHPLFGKWIDATGRHDWGLAVAGVLPLVAWLALVIGWGREPVAPCADTAGV
jgi:ACS family hexuronate transporter-like MFS transporter